MPDILKPWEQFKDVKPWDLEWGAMEEPAQNAPVGPRLPQFESSLPLVPPTAQDTAEAQANANPLTALSKPIVNLIPKIGQETMGRILSLPAALARQRIEETPDQIVETPEGPTEVAPKQPALEAVAKAVPSDKAVAVATGVQHAAADTANFFTSPIGIATLGIGSLPAAVGRTVALGFAAQMAKDVPEIAKQLGEELGKPEDQRDYEKISELAANAVANTAFVGLGVKHGLAEPIAGKLGALPSEQPAVIPTAQPKEESARTQQKAAEIHGDLLSSTGEGKGALPVKEGESRIQSETEGRLSKEALNSVGKSPTADQLLQMTPMQSVEWKRNNQYGPAVSQAIAEKLTPEEAAKIKAHGEDLAQQTRDAFVQATDLRNKAKELKSKAGESASDEESTKLNEQADSTMNQANAINNEAMPVSLKSQTMREIIEDYDALKKENKPELDPFESFLNKAIDFTDPGQQLGGGQLSLGIAKLPVWLAKEVAHGSLKVIRAAYRAGKDTTKAIAAGVEWLRDKKLDGFNENEAKAWFSNAIKSEGSDVTGVAQRVREKVAAAGQEALPPRGEGISAPDSVERGEQLLNLDKDSADKAMTAFERDPNKAVSADAMAVARAKLRQLAQAARAAEAKFGIASDEYKKAWKERSDWAARIKPLQTEWHKTGMAQQGEQDIDTGTFTGLREAYTDATGKDFTPDQAGTAKTIAGKVGGAQTAVDTAKTTLAGQLREPSGTAAEQRALDAASKTVREADVRMADSENKTRVAQVERDRAIQKVQDDAAAKAARAASKTVRESDIRDAKAENKARVAAVERKLEAAKAQEKAAKKAQDTANKVVRDAAARASKAAVDARVNPEKRVWDKVQEYLDQGMDNFDDIRTKAATDLGMTVKQVTDLLTRNKRTKFLADDLWRKQEALRRFKQQAQRWLKSTALPNYQKALAAIPRTLFALKVGFHGTVALGTHAPMVFFQPPKWGMYFRDFGKMYRMVGSPKYYEMQVQELLRRPNYTRARRAGLVNDPASYEDYNSPLISQYIGRLSGMGNRGYSVLKILRQDMFDQHWNSLPKTAQIDEMASAIADGVNHATGVVKGAAPKGSNVVLFAPRLAASRVMWLAGDPLRAADTFARWNKADIAEKEFAINQVKEKAWVAGTLLGLLALNQGVLSATGSKQKVNFDDPFHSDWLKFKAAGMTASYGNAMLTMARLPIRMYKIRESDGGKLKNVIHPDESSYTVLGEYARSQLSPFMSLASDLWLKGDWQNRPLPSSTRPVPKRLQSQGVYPYTWPEFWTEQVLPIPAEEAVREVWNKGLGMNPEQVEQTRKAMATLAVMSLTGARLTDDVQAH
jgi:hypothetical protein